MTLMIEISRILVCAAPADDTNGPVLEVLCVYS